MGHTRFNRLDGCTYSLSESGDILVEDTQSGEKGIFDQYGAHLEGALRQADVQMCQFVAKLGKHRPNA